MYVLLAVFLTIKGMPVATLNAEFASQGACLQAAMHLRAMQGDSTVKTSCVAK